MNFQVTLQCMASPPLGFTVGQLPRRGHAILQFGSLLFIYEHSEAKLATPAFRVEPYIQRTHFRFTVHLSFSSTKLRDLAKN